MKHTVDEGVCDAGTGAMGGCDPLLLEHCVHAQAVSPRNALCTLQVAALHTRAKQLLRRGLCG